MLDRAIHWFRRDLRISDNTVPAVSVSPRPTVFIVVSLRIQGVTTAENPSILQIPGFTGLPMDMSPS